VPVSFDDLISRAAEPTLNALVGPTVVRLLARIDPASTRPDQLREVALGLRSSADLLLDAASRTELLDLLRRSEAEALCRTLRIDVSDPYASLADVKIRRGTQRSAYLLDFFSVAEPTLEKADVPSELRLSPAHGLFHHQRIAARRLLSQLEA